MIKYSDKNMILIQIWSSKNYSYGKKFQDFGIKLLFWLKHWYLIKYDYDKDMFGRNKIITIQI